MIQRADPVTDSAAAARDEIGRAMAAKIAEVKNARDLKKISEDILPALEKFLESPEERRLRQTRDGVLTTAAGLGIAVISKMIYFLVHDAELFGLIAGGLGILSFLVGLAMIINGVFFTVPRKLAVSDSGLHGENGPAATNNLHLPAQPDSIPGSVTEGTTHQLKPDSIKSTDPI
jgi:hypothetical protein